MAIIRVYRIGGVSTGVGDEVTNHCEIHNYITCK